MLYIYTVTYLAVLYLLWTAILTGLETKSKLVAKMFPKTYENFWMFEGGDVPHTSQNHYATKVDIFLSCMFWPFIIPLAFVMLTLYIINVMVRWCFTSLWNLTQSNKEYHKEDPTTF